MLTPVALLVHLAMWQHKLLILHLVIHKLPVADMFFVLICRPHFVSKLPPLLSLHMLENTTRVETRIELAVRLSSFGMDEFAVWSRTGLSKLAQFLLWVSKYTLWVGAVREVFAVLFRVVGDLLSWRWVATGAFEILTCCSEFADITGINWRSVFSRWRLVGIGTVLLRAVLIEPANGLPGWLWLGAFNLHGRGHIAHGGPSTIRHDTILNI